MLAQRQNGCEAGFFDVLDSENFAAASALEWGRLLYGWKDQLCSDVGTNSGTLG
jgi:hypothetical protein